MAMDKTFIVALIIAGFLLSVVGLQFEVAKANPYGPYQPAIITISSPASNEVYNTSTVAFNFTIATYSYTYNSWDRVMWLNCSLSGQAGVEVTLSPTIDYRGNPLIGSAMLTDLPDGPYTIRIYGQTIIGNDPNTVTHDFSKETSFTINTQLPIATPPPSPSPSPSPPSSTPSPSASPSPTPPPTLTPVFAGAGVAIAVAAGMIIFVKKARK
jgi:hypothetical protein